MWAESWLFSSSSTHCFIQLLTFANDYTFFIYLRTMCTFCTYRCEGILEQDILVILTSHHIYKQVHIKSSSQIRNSRIISIISEVPAWVYELRGHLCATSKLATCNYHDNDSTWRQHLSSLFFTINFPTSLFLLSPCLAVQAFGCLFSAILSRPAC